MTGSWVSMAVVDALQLDAGFVGTSEEARGRYLKVLCDHLMVVPVALVMQVVPAKLAPWGRQRERGSLGAAGPRHPKVGEE